MTDEKIEVVKGVNNTLRFAHAKCVEAMAALGALALAGWATDRQREAYTSIHTAMKLIAAEGRELAECVEEERASEAQGALDLANAEVAGQA